MVLTDGESRPFGAELGSAYPGKPPIDTVLVRFGNADERIYSTGEAEGYVPAKNSEETMQRVADLMGGRAFSEDDVSAAGDAVAEIIGEGETSDRTIPGARVALMPWVTLAAFLPLGFLLWRRNRALGRSRVYAGNKASRLGVSDVDEVDVREVEQTLEDALGAFTAGALQCDDSGPGPAPRTSARVYADPAGIHCRRNGRSRPLDETDPAEGTRRHPRSCRTCIRSTLLEPPTGGQGPGAGVASVSAVRANATSCGTPSRQSDSWRSRSCVVSLSWVT